MYKQLTITVRRVRVASCIGIRSSFVDLSMNSESGRIINLVLRSAASNDIAIVVNAKEVRHAHFV